jgi:hypothetical protein
MTDTALDFDTAFAAFVDEYQKQAIAAGTKAQAAAGAKAEAEL